MRALILAILLLPFVFAQTCAVNGETSSCGISADQSIPSLTDNTFTYENTTFTFERNSFDVGKEVTFIITTQDPAFFGKEPQGQIIDPASNKEIYYALVVETTPGTYSFTWTPSFAGQYYIQYLFREDAQIVKPLFTIRVDDPRSRMAMTASYAVLGLSLLIGIILSIKTKKIKPVLTGIGISLLALVLGYSVSAFYDAGGEKGFVVCGEGTCQLAIHWHSQLHMNVCGEPYHLPLESGDLDRVHTHKELDYLHFHSLVKTDAGGVELLEPEKLAVGDLFDQLDIRFTNECFGDYCNGDACPNGETGMLRMTVNGIENNQFDNYSYKDGDDIKLEFGP